MCSIKRVRYVTHVTRNAATSTEDCILLYDVTQKEFLIIYFSRNHIHMTCFQAHTFNKITIQKILYYAQTDFAKGDTARPGGLGLHTRLCHTFLVITVILLSA